MAIRAFSRVADGIILLMCCDSLPRCVIMIMYIEYKAVISILRPVKIIVNIDHENDDKIISNSPIRLIVGGRARFVRLARIHQENIRGRVICKPRASSSVRL